MQIDRVCPRLCGWPPAWLGFSWNGLSWNAALKRSEVQSPRPIARIIMALFHRVSWKIKWDNTTDCSIQGNIITGVTTPTSIIECYESSLYPTDPSNSQFLFDLYTSSNREHSSYCHIQPFVECKFFLDYKWDMSLWSAVFLKLYPQAIRLSWESAMHQNCGRFGGGDIQRHGLSFGKFQSWILVIWWIHRKLSLAWLAGPSEDFKRSSTQKAPSLWFTIWFAPSDLSWY